MSALVARAQSVGRSHVGRNGEDIELSKKKDQLEAPTGRDLDSTPDMGESKMTSSLIAKRPRAPTPEDAQAEAAAGSDNPGSDSADEGHGVDQDPGSQGREDDGRLIKPKNT